MDHAKDDEVTNDWLAVWYTDDGPFVDGPFPTADAAHESIIAFYMGEYGETREEAEERYETTGDEWVTRLHSPSYGPLAEAS